MMRPEAGSITTWATSLSPAKKPTSHSPVDSLRLAGGTRFGCSFSSPIAPPPPVHLFAARGRPQIWMLLPPRDRFRTPLGDLARPALGDLRRRGARRGRHQQGCDQREGGSENERTDQANVHSLLPTKLNG